MTRGLDREVFVRFFEMIRRDDQIEIVPASSELLHRGVELFANRPDKQWSLTDCISLVIMSGRAIQYALTADVDFEQAGYRPLLREEPGPLA